MSLKTGTTLIELLLAITIALIVITVVFTMFHTASRVVESQEARQEGPALAARAVDQMMRDLNCASIPDESPECEFSLGTAQSGDADEVLVRFCTAGIPSDEDMRWFELEAVVYRFRPGRDGQGVLFREHLALAGPGSEGSMTTNLLATRIERFEVEAFDGQTWSREWSSGGLPHGARVLLESDGRIYTAQAFIPAAHVVTSAFIRASSPAP